MRYTLAILSTLNGRARENLATKKPSSASAPGRKSRSAEEVPAAAGDFAPLRPLAADHRAAVGSNARKTLKTIVERYTSLTRLGHELGRSLQWVWRIIFSAKSFPLEKSEEILHRLGVPLRFFFDQVAGEEPEPEPAFLLGFFREDQRLPRAAFLIAELEGLRALAAPAVPAGGPAPLIDSERQRELEALRFRDRDGALRELETAMLQLVSELQAERSRGRLADLATLLAIWASAQMSLGRRADSCDALMAAFELAQSAKNGRALGVCWQRGAYLLADLGQLRYANLFIEKAAVEFAMAGAYERLPGVTIGRGIFRQSMGQLEASVDDLKNARAAVAPDDWRLHAVASQALAVTYELQGKIPAARAALADAVAAWRVDDFGRAPLLWRRGSLALAEGHLEDADLALRGAMILYEKYGEPLDCALVALDLAKCLVRRRKLSTLRELGRQVLAWRPLFANNPIAAAAMIDLSCTLERAAAEARVRAETLSKLTEQLRSTDPRRRPI
jgi:tetratricopeptide (TPR) repeat protein